eukprot:CAMPEP_0174852232 /NCGR_PEP_ID=MMETSP1114-20130205/25258_1 /TAXON_ID=312471 /ORGANISM="Neobodo designis, Strain CCAP 1951/1" /LENGTH=72 /DNA_ID=CAMNT_0016086813 /DNA_START=27 /DNA_END=245 /DNA_ORIENTATION=+
MATEGETPSPVRQVRQFEADEAAAEKLQQEFDDEARAAHLEEVERIDAEFDEATRRVDEERNQKALERLRDA